jgi:type IV pilus assembly protein PilM
MSRQIECAGCQQLNPVERRFCGQCGRRLWEPCAACQAVNAIDERFCGGCGANLRQALQERSENYRRCLELAQRLEAEGRFEEAADQLKRVTVSGHSELEVLEREATNLVSELAERRQRTEGDVDQASALAVRLKAEHKYVQCQQVLSAIPLQLRNRQVMEMLQEVERACRTIADLKVQIREALQQKAYAGLLPKVRRLCELQPGSQELHELRTKLEKLQRDKEQKQAERALKDAQQLLRLRRYQEAVDALETVAPHLRKGAIEAAYRDARELAWCVSLVCQAPVVDSLIGKAIERLTKLRPDDPRPDQWRAALAERTKLKPKDRRLPHLPWASTANRTSWPLGIPVNWWAGIQPHAIADSVAAETVANHPGQFAVAHGLALQGLGLAVLNHDLSERPSGWNRLLRRRPVKAQTVWGVDLSPRGIKAMELAADGSGAAAEIRRVLVVPHRKPLSRRVSDEECQKLEEESVATLLTEIGEQRPNLVVGFPARLSLGRNFQIPSSRGKKVEETVAYEARHQIPLPFEETSFDYHVWQQPESPPEPAMRSVVLIAARKRDVVQRAALFGNAELLAIQSDCYALYNTLHFQFLRTAKSQTGRAGETGRAAGLPPAIAVLDVGSESSLLVIGTPTSVWFRGLGIGAESWTDLLTREFPLSRDQAEKVRRDPTLARYAHQIHDVLAGAFDALQQEVERSLQSYTVEVNDAPIPQLQALLGVGGGFSQFGLLAHLSGTHLPKKNRHEGEFLA